MANGQANILRHFPDTSASTRAKNLGTNVVQSGLLSSDALVLGTGLEPARLAATASKAFLSSSYPIVSL
jgi:hypothetical protein